MKRELVKCLRTVTLLAIFSRDSSTVSNIQSCLKSMTIMEPDLILHPILERAYPALESLVEVRQCYNICKSDTDNHAFSEDSSNNSRDQSFGRRGACYGFKRGILFWSQESYTYLTAPDSRDRSCKTALSHIKKLLIWCLFLEWSWKDCESSQLPSNGMSGVYHICVIICLYSHSFAQLRS